ncbi:MAG: chorismate mutase [Candidatus Eisenbacteria bacterium]|uniref:chorismate mutase n=1 Tax=Eiseniibacteriota bacterium TaxID=2212470 RepID=A0A538UBF8_UNCEI|nr:MAG: chorismate mutase [Candidatus Eisenbacteria bacterium]
MAPSQPDRSGIAAVRGAVPIRVNRADDIIAGTARLLTAILEVNRLERAQIVSAVFTATEDLDADFPAHAARRLGWTDVPLLNAREIPVPGTMKRVVRVLLTVSGVAPGTRLQPVYLDEAAALRPDVAGGQAPSPEAPGPSATASEGPVTPRHIAIIGLGQIGGSVARSLGRVRGWWRVGYDRDAATLLAARSAGVIDQVAESLETACAGADVALLATPVDTLPALVAAAARALPQGAALIDTGSTRGPVTAALEAAAAQGIRAVGGHPLTGSEGHGFAASRADLFADTTFTLSPVGADVPEVVAQLLRDLGARPLLVAPERHDQALARTSHLPYLVACALRELGGEMADQGLSGPGFRDMTRLAASDARIAGAYCRANAEAVGAAWRALREALDRAVTGLEATG